MSDNKNLTAKRLYLKRNPSFLKVDQSFNYYFRQFFLAYRALHDHFAAMSKIQENADYCLNIVRSDDPDRYLLSLFAPQTSQESLWALYAFNQEVAKIRDTVSEPMLGEIRIQWWQDVLEEIEQGQIREQPVIIELAKVLEHFPIRKQLDDMLSARKSDALGEGKASFEALSEYAHGVGGALYEAAAQIICKDLSETGQSVAQKLGSAWAMLGLVRALPHSWQTNASPVAEEMKPGLQSTSATDANILLKPVISKMLSFVEKQTNEALTQKEKLSKTEQPLLLLATQIKLYQFALTKTANNPFELIQNEPSQLRKLWKLFIAKLTSNY